MAIALENKSTFYESFLMGRKNFNPQDFGIDMDREAFDDMIIEAFGSAFHGQLTIDELLLHPRTALRFCDDVRMARGFHDLPDDIILRIVLQRRKNPAR